MFTVIIDTHKYQNLTEERQAVATHAKTQFLISRFEATATNCSRFELSIKGIMKYVLLLSRFSTLAVYRGTIISLHFPSGSKFTT